MRSSDWKYKSKKERERIATIILGTYIDEAEGDLVEVQDLIKASILKYERMEEYEHCAILKYILEQYFE